MTGTSLCDTLTTEGGPFLLKTLVLAAAGTVRHELLSFLRSVPELMLVDVSDGGLGSCHSPCVDLVILDAGMPNCEAGELLREVRARLPSSRCIVLVRSPRQTAEIMANGADRVLLAGFPATEFFKTLEFLIEDEVMNS